MNSQSLNRFAYVNGNPIMGIDPNGHFVTILIGAGIGAAVGGIGDMAAQWSDKGWNGINWKEVAFNAGTGAVTGAIAGTGIGVLGMVGGRARILCNSIEQKSSEARSRLAFMPSHFTPLHKTRYGIGWYHS